MSLASYLLDPKYKDSTAATTAYLLGLTPEISEEEDKPLKFPSLPGLSLPGISGPKIEGPSVSSPSVTTPGLATPSVGLPGATSPNLGLSGLDLSKLTGSLPSVTTSLPAVGIKAPELTLPLGLSGLNLSGLSGIDLSKLGLGDYSGVAGAALPAVKVGTQGVSFSPSVGQALNIGKEVADLAAKNPLLSSVGQGVSNVLGTAGNVAGQIGNIVSSPLVQLATVIANDWANWQSRLQQADRDAYQYNQVKNYLGENAIKATTDEIKNYALTLRDSDYDKYNLLYSNAQSLALNYLYNENKAWFDQLETSKAGTQKSQGAYKGKMSIMPVASTQQTTVPASSSAKQSVRWADAANAAIQAHLKGGALYNG